MQQVNEILPVMRRFKTEAGHHNGSIYSGIGFTISVRRGIGSEVPDGASIAAVMGACLKELEYHQAGKYACPENQAAVAALTSAIQRLSPAPSGFAKNWSDSDGNHNGSLYCGMGYALAFQRGPMADSDESPRSPVEIYGGKRNGALLIEVLRCCMAELQFQCECVVAPSQPTMPKNSEQALKSASQDVEAAIDALQERLVKRSEAGILGTHDLG